MGILDSAEDIFGSVPAKGLSNKHKKITPEEFLPPGKIGWGEEVKIPAEFSEPAYMEPTPDEEINRFSTSAGGKAQLKDLMSKYYALIVRGSETSAVAPTPKYLWTVKFGGQFAGIIDDVYASTGGVKTESTIEISGEAAEIFVRSVNIPGTTTQFMEIKPSINSLPVKVPTGVTVENLKIDFLDDSAGILRQALYTMASRRNTDYNVVDNIANNTANIEQIGNSFNNQAIITINRYSFNGENVVTYKYYGSQVESVSGEDLDYTTEELSTFSVGISYRRVAVQREAKTTSTTSVSSTKKKPGLGKLAQDKFKFIPKTTPLPGITPENPVGSKPYGFRDAITDVRRGIKVYSDVKNEVNKAKDLIKTVKSTVDGIKNGGLTLDNMGAVMNSAEGIYNQGAGLGEYGAKVFTGLENNTGVFGKSVGGAVRSAGGAVSDGAGYVGDKVSDGASSAWESVKSPFTAPPTPSGEYTSAAYGAGGTSFDQTKTTSTISEAPPQPSWYQF